MTGVSGIVFWIVISAILVLIEMATVQLVCIWFAAGAFFAAAACFVDAPFWLQLLIFLVSSIAVLIVGRPLLVDRLTPKKQATNADRVIGQLGVVLEEINNLNQTGRATANGLDWTARSAYGEVIPKGTTVLVLQIDGVKLIVQPLPPPEPEPTVPQYYTPPSEPAHPEPPAYRPVEVPQPENTSHQPEQPVYSPQPESIPQPDSSDSDSYSTQTPQG